MGICVDHLQLLATRQNDSFSLAGVKVVQVDQVVEKHGVGGDWDVVRRERQSRIGDEKERNLITLFAILRYS